MSTILVEGGHPLMGSVSVSGAKNSALKLIPAAMFSNEDVILDNVPKVQSVISEIEAIHSIGGQVTWVGNNRLLLNGSGINTYEVPYELGSKFRTILLLAGPLLYRFGKAVLPKYNSKNMTVGTINRFLESWKSLGIEVEETPHYIKLSSGSIRNSQVNFKTASHMATDSTILSSVFVPGETVIQGASEESEIDDLIDLLCLMGANVRRIDPKTIKIVGTNIFKGASLEIQSDKYEAAVWATCAVLTKGNIIIKNVTREVLIPLVNFLNKLGVRFDFSSDRELKVWRHNDKLNPLTVVVSPTPGFIPDWQPLATLILTQADGQSLVHDTVYTDHFDYIKDLNRMGAKIELITPTKAGFPIIISDDSYDFSQKGEPFTVAKIKGPTKLRGEKIHLSDIRYGSVLLLATLLSEGRSTISEIEYVTDYMEGFLDKLQNLGAYIWKQVE